MASQGQSQLIGFDTAAVVADCDAAHPAFLDAQLDALRTGIDRIFKQLLDHRSRPLDDFAGRDLADQMIGQGGNPAAPALVTRVTLGRADRVTRR